jgi:hypothetical protein
VQFPAFCLVQFDLGLVVLVCKATNRTDFGQGLNLDNTRIARVWTVGQPCRASYPKTGDPGGANFLRFAELAASIGLVVFGVLTLLDFRCSKGAVV